MHRIAALPKRRWEDLTEESVSALTEALRTPSGQQTLRPFQAVLLREALELDGAYGMGRVGIGKRLVSLLAGELMQEPRVLILCPSGEKADAEREFHEYRKHWNGVDATKYKLLGYGDISRFPLQGLTLKSLWGGLGPTLIIPDEAQKLRRVHTDKGASALALQVNDYLAANPETKVLALTGTPDNEGILDYAHILQWCLRDRSPLPTNWDDLCEWSEVIDKGDNRCAKKVCQQLGIEHTDSIDQIRLAYRERLRATPGVVIADEPFDGPLEFESILLPPWGMEEHFTKLRKQWQRPDGWDLSPDGPTEEEERQPDRVAAQSIWGVERQLALGFCYVADPVPPESWMEARRLYFKAVRTALRNRVFYTQWVFNAAGSKRELKPSWQKAYDDWEEMRPKFIPGQKVLWLSNHALDFCQEWGQEPGIIWVDHIAFGAELEKRTGWRYFQGGGKDRKGKHIAKASSEETIIASGPANSTGRNLQKPPHGWHRNLITAMPGNNAMFEQRVGRTHRELQPFTVKVDVMVSCKAHLGSIRNVLQDAERQATTLMNQKVTTFPWKHVNFNQDGVFYND